MAKLRKLRVAYGLYPVKVRFLYHRSEVEELRITYGLYQVKVRFL